MSGRIRIWQAALLSLPDDHDIRQRRGIARITCDDDVPRVLIGPDGEVYVLATRQDSDGRLLYAEEKVMRLGEGLIGDTGAGLRATP